MVYASQQVSVVNKHFWGSRMSSNKVITGDILNHHGLVASTIQELGIIDKINGLIKSSTDPRRIVSPGEAAAALMLNGLGFTNRRLYITHQFFENKPVGRLLNNDKIKTENLTDDTFGKMLDEISAYGTTKLFGEVVFEIMAQKNLFGKFGRFDTTTFSVEGAYDREEKERIINITYGYSKDHRPDLKQMTLLMGMMGPSKIPFWIEPLDGNKSDKTSLPEAIKTANEFYKQMKDAPQIHYVADSALYNAKKLLNKNNTFPWITRVPNTVRKALDILETPIEDNRWTTCGFDPSYKFCAEWSDYGGIRQKWLLVFSQKKFKRDKASLEKKIKKEEERVNKELVALSREKFDCKEDAKKRLEKFNTKNKLFNITGNLKEVKKNSKKGRTSKGPSSQKLVYKIEGTASLEQRELDRLMQRLGKFILATNELDETILPNESILVEYKGQNSVERGFAFLKDPWFMVSSIYLKKKSRIAALMVIMALCLLVYNFAQYTIRKKLKDKGETIPSQIKKPTSNPSLKWIFQIMEGVVIFNLRKGKTTISHVVNLTDLRKKIISLFGISAEKIYGFA